jgi:hypothetical protein
MADARIGVARVRIPKLLKVGALADALPKELLLKA